MCPTVARVGRVEGLLTRLEFPPEVACGLPFVSEEQLMSADPQLSRAVPSGPSIGLLDDVDRRLLQLLTDDPRLSKSALARAAGISTPTASSRVARLERQGVIRGYRLDVDPAALGYAVMAWVRVRPGPGQLTRVVELAQRTPEVGECHRVTGEDCFIMRVHATSLQAVEQVLDRFLLYGQTTSAITVSSPVELRPPPIVAP
jgi:Lrp/AsnC family leucine-responsive transcriptional regulator